MPGQDLLDDDLRELDRVAEEQGAAGLSTLQSTVERLRDAGDQDRLMWTLPPLARSYALCERFDDAESAANEALAHFRGNGSVRGQALGRWALREHDENLPQTTWRPRAERAIELLEPTLRAWRADKKWAEICNALDHLAISYTVLGDLAAAHASLDEAESLMDASAAHSMVFFSCARARAHLEACHDQLAGLANRRRFDEFLWRLLPRASDEHPVSLVLIDLDHFKSINDRYLHLAGDAALSWVAQCRQTDLPARLGGDEFALVLAAPLAIAHQVCNRLRSAVAELATDLPADITIRLSAGLAEATASCDANHIFKREDEALYAAKAAGRDAVHDDPADDPQD